MKKLFLFIFVFAFACNDNETALPENITSIEAVFNNSTLGPVNSHSYLLTLNKSAKTGLFNLQIPAQGFEGSTTYTATIVLSDSDVEDINLELEKVRYKDCTATEQLIGAGQKQVSFSYSQDDQIIVYTIDTNDLCVEGVDNFYFSSSYSALYELFEDIIESQNDLSGLPENWKDYI